MCARILLPQLSRSKQYKTSEIGALLYGRYKANGIPYCTQALALMASSCLKHLSDNGLIHYYYRNGTEKRWYSLNIDKRGYQ